MNIHAHSGPTPRGRGVSEALVAGSVRIEHRSAIASNRSFPMSNSGQEILGVAVLIQPDFASKMPRARKGRKHVLQHVNRRMSAESHTVES